MMSGLTTRNQSRPGRDPLEPLDVAPWTNRQASAQAARAAEARRLSQRRRHVEPATCERDYSRDEVEFMNAMQLYKQRSGRMFPTWSEVLEVLYDLGYRKTAAEASNEVGRAAALA